MAFYPCLFDSKPFFEDLAELAFVAGGASSVSWHLPHSLPCHCPYCDGHLQGVQCAIQDLPNSKSVPAA